MDEIIAVYLSTPDPIHTGISTIEAPIPNSPTTNPPTNPTILNGANGVIGPRTGQWNMSNIRFYNFPATTTILETCSKCKNLFTNTGA